MCNQQFNSDFVNNTQGMAGIHAILRDYMLPGGKKGAKPAAPVAASTSTLLTAGQPAPGKDVLIPDMTPMTLNKPTLLGM